MIKGICGRSLVAALTRHVICRNISSGNANVERAKQDVGILAKRVLSYLNGRNDELSFKFHQSDTQLIGATTVVKFISFDDGYTFEIRERNGNGESCKTRTFRDFSIIKLDNKFFICLGDKKSVHLIYLEEV